MGPFPNAHDRVSNITPKEGCQELGELHTTARLEMPLNLVSRRRGGPPAHRPSGRGPGCGFAPDRAIAPPSQAGVGFGLWLGSPVWFCRSLGRREIKLRRHQGPTSGGVRGEATKKGFAYTSVRVLEQKKTPGGVGVGAVAIKFIHSLSQLHLSSISAPSQLHLSSISQLYLSLISALSPPLFLQEHPPLVPTW